MTSLSPVHTIGNQIQEALQLRADALARYTAADFVRLVERHRIPYHEKKLGQLFCDESSQQVIDLLVDGCERAGVRWAHPCSVRRVERIAAACAVTASRATWCASTSSPRTT